MSNGRCARPSACFRDVVFACCLASLFLRQESEEPEGRSFVDQCRDVSKQLLGAVWLYMVYDEGPLGGGSYMLDSPHGQMDECEQYWLALVAWSTFGVFFDYALFFSIACLYRYSTGASGKSTFGTRTGDSYHSQLLVWIAAVTGTHYILWWVVARYGAAWIAVVSMLLKPVAWNPVLEFLVVSIFTPFCATMLQVWLIDDLMRHGLPLREFFAQLERTAWRGRLQEALLPQSNATTPGAAISAAGAPACMVVDKQLLAHDDVDKECARSALATAPSRNKVLDARIASLEAKWAAAEAKLNVREELDTLQRQRCALEDALSFREEHLQNLQSKLARAEGYIHKQMRATVDTERRARKHHERGEQPGEDERLLRHQRPTSSDLLTRKPCTLNAPQDLNVLREAHHASVSASRNASHSATRNASRNASRRPSGAATLDAKIASLEAKVDSLDV